MVCMTKAIHSDPDDQRYRLPAREADEQARPARVTESVGAGHVRLRFRTQASAPTRLGPLPAPSWTDDHRRLDDGAEPPDRPPIDRVGRRARPRFRCG